MLVVWDQKTHLFFTVLFLSDGLDLMLCTPENFIDSSACTTSSKSGLLEASWSQHLDMSRAKEGGHADVGGRKFCATRW